jgi:hypothetical protein
MRAVQKRVYARTVKNKRAARWSDGFPH